MFFTVFIKITFTLFLNTRGFNNNSLIHSNKINAYIMKNIFLKLFPKKTLKFILLFGVICILFMDNSNAQSTNDSNALSIYYGGRFGTTISQFTNQQPHTSSIQGIVGGAFIGYAFNDNMAVQLEINYLEEGGQLLKIETEADLGYDTWYMTKVDNQKLILHNIDVPLMFRYSIPLGSAKLFALIGADLGVNIYSGISHETTVYADDGNILTYSGNEDVTSKIERYNVGATAGIGFEIPVFTSNYILIDVRYRYGVMPSYVGYSYRGIPQVTGDLSNNTMYFTIGFGF